MECSVLKYLLTQVRGTSLCWVPLTPENMSVLTRRKVEIANDFVIDVNNPQELETLGADFITALVNRNLLN